MRTSTVLGWWLLLVSTGCDGCGASENELTEGTRAASETAPSEPDEAPGVSETAQAPAAEAPAAPPKPAPPTPAVLNQTREARAALRAGRLAGQAGNWAEAVTKFQESVEKNDSASARCELGWAQYQAGALGPARTELVRGAAMLRRRASVREGEANTLGACLYNLGRVVEENDAAAAATHYRESLEVRPGNRVVQARLDALGAPPPSASCEPRACVGPARGATALATLVAQHYGRDTAETNETAEGTDPFLFRGGVSGEPRHGDGIFLAVPDDGAWFVCFVLEDEGAVYEYGEVHSRQWIMGGRPELDFEISTSWHGRELGIANEMGGTERSFVGWVDDKPVMYGAVGVLEYYYDGEWVDCDCHNDDDDDDDDDGYSYDWDCCDLKAIEQVSRWNLQSAGSGQLRSTRVEGEREEDEPPTETYTIVDLSCRNQTANPG